jgi:hypothetical protein
MTVEKECLNEECKIDHQAEVGLVVALLRALIDEVEAGHVWGLGLEWHRGCLGEVKTMAGGELNSPFEKEAREKTKRALAPILDNIDALYAQAEAMKHGKVH